MSDKSFGDHANRNIVKNPLLSTAVTGLSIEDLTHNAVLLPAAPNQGLITRSEHQIGSHAQSLGQPDNELANHPSGDSNSNILPPHYSTTTIPNILDHQSILQDDRQQENICFTQSKAVPKSEDDFDVNEYFARLHGTRYVSAPLNTQLADQNANLAAEDNLEEINLNDDKPEVQHSLTADIAQNFSQLPTVLPHMASAVFSSFSSMLNLKSREQTPDDGKAQVYQGYVQSESVPLMSVENVAKEAAPPPKEPPVTGPSSYRITSKKKYAQIPGLSSGEAQPRAYCTASQSDSSYFVPTVQDTSVNLTDHVENMTLIDGNKVEDTKPPNYNESINMSHPNKEITDVKGIGVIKPPVLADSFNMFNPMNSAGNLEDAASNYQPNLPPATKDTEFIFPEQSPTVIPPPPMFSTQKRSSQTTGKSVLPPSVARRIGSNHPVIKQQTMQTTALTDNIFIPTFDPMTTASFPSQSIGETTTVPAFSFSSSQPPIFNPQSLSTHNATLYSTPLPFIPTSPPMEPSIPMSQPTIGPQPPISAIGPPKLPPAVPPRHASTIPSNTNVFIPPHVLTSSVAALSSTIFTPTEVSQALPSQDTMTSTVPPASAIFAPQSPPTIPSTLYNPMSVKEEIKSDLFAPPMELNKPTVEPPKSTGINFRMTKKRPQYYSGPIEGVGAISNNTKPILPTVETGTFQGALFTPNKEATLNAPASIPFDISQTASVPTELNAASMPQPIAFDIVKQVDTYTPCDVNKPQEQNIPLPFNTAFDLSRPTTDYYEEHKENKGFGIIGSLKSKLSSLDINKIQNTVTTFFDPTYNESKKDDAGAQENVPYNQMTVQQSGQGNFEIFVPNVKNTHGYFYDSHNTYYQDQYYSNYNQAQDQAYQGYYSASEATYAIDHANSSQSHQIVTDNTVNANVFATQTTTAGAHENVDSVKLYPNATQQDTTSFVDTETKTQKNIEEHTPEDTKIKPVVKSFEEISAKNFFDMDTLKTFPSALPVQTETIPSNVETIDTFSTQVKGESTLVSDYSAPIMFEQPNTLSNKPFISGGPIVTSIEDSKPIDLFTNTKFDAKVTKKLPKADNLLESISKDEIPIVRVSSVPLFGLSTVISDVTTDLTELSDTITSLYENKEDMFDRNASVSFFENIGTAEPTEGENISELNICETCREFNKPEEREDKDVDDLTTQLIENITSRIQLSNPVEALLTEPNVASNDNVEYENNQFNEISHITEETIETIQVQSATELLDDEDETQPRNYGWATEDDNNPNDSTDFNLEHDYSFTIDPNTIGFYGNNSLFFDNVPTNASDEIKAEFKHHEDLLPRQASIPSAPPAEEDTKSNETGGLDVHSIEQDAKNDFPIYEEFVIEPSETDDDKIEYRERERSDDSQSDTFTNRVERFKKMEEVDGEEHKAVFELSNPPITMASYFDTGNFAAETHYRNSISSPTQISIPPGFEEEFKKRLQMAKALNNVKSVPETSTQTRTTQVLTFSTAHNEAPVGFNIETNITNLVDDSSERLPEYSSFDTKDDIKAFGGSDISAGLISLVEGARFPTAFDTSLESKLFEAPSLIGDSKFPTFVSKPTEHTLPNIPTLTSFDDQAVSPEDSLRAETQGIVTSGLGDANFSSVFGFNDTGLSTGLLTNLVDKRHISADFGNEDDELSDFPTSLLPADLVEDANFATSFDSAVSKHSAHPDKTELVTEDINVATTIKPIREHTEPTRYFSTVTGVDKSKDNETDDIATNILTASLFGNSYIPTFDPKTINMGMVSNLFEDKKPFEVKESSIDIQPRVITQLFDKSLPVFKPEADQDITTQPKIPSKAFTTDIPEGRSGNLTDHASAFNLFVDKKPFEVKELSIDTQPSVMTQLFDKSQPVFKPEAAQDITTQPKIPSKVFTTNIPEGRSGKSTDHATAFNPRPLPELPKIEPNLPDANNFFSTENPADAPESFSRLASYFSSPPKTEHAKSFFELSQSQNHYRHAPLIINDDRLINLMKDLTSTQNIEVEDQIVRHVNYFTVEYDSEVVFNKGDVKGSPKSELADVENKESLESAFAKCEYCLKGLNIDKGCKFRKAMDDNCKDTDRNSGNMDGSKDTGKRSSTVTFEGITHEEANENVTVVSEGPSTPDYVSVKHHWFYRVDIEGKSIWRGFSLADSRALEIAYDSPDLNETTVVATDGGRYDVNIMSRLRIPVYWDDKPTNVRRCSWFYKGTTDARYVPYTEPVADKLEEEYRHGTTCGVWHRRLVLPNGEVVVMHGPGVMVHFLQSGAADTFTGTSLFSFGKRVYRNPPKIRVSQDQPIKIDHLILFVHGAGEYRHQKERKESISRPRVVRRGHDESEIEDTEPSSIDHLLLLCHGVGSACDMRFRSVEEVVEDFRATSLQLLQSHYRNSYDKGIVSRVEVLPISWHESLHSGETGVDRRLSQLTLDSIPRLRHFTNDTLLDVLFYTSPVYGQTIIDTVGRELNRIYKLFKERNPNFKGGVSLGGHSLGSVILYDLLCNQSTGIPHKSTDGGNPQAAKNYVSGSSGVNMQYPILAFSPDSLYALGSPIAIFECIRGVESLGLNFGLPTCKNFFNIFHPYDPIAYRIEPLINPELRELKPFLIPHHKGRKRMHLELKDTMARVSADLKQKLLESLKTTWNKWRAQPAPNGQLPNVVEEDLDKEPLTDDSKEEMQQDNEWSTPEMLGRLNGGRRIDYVLQEAPLEMINEYIFAMSSHVGYWESEDTMLLMLREIYNTLGVQPDCTVPQHTLTVQRARNAAKQDDGIMLNASELPSTSYGYDMRDIDKK